MVERARQYVRFVWRGIRVATDGGVWFYVWMVALTALTLLGVNAWATQVSAGLAVTGLSDHVSWGLYIANFTFAVGLAAGAVTMVIPAYLYDDHEMHDVVIVGELMAVSAIVVALAFIMADLGRIDRFWHMVPPFGLFNFPQSMFTWDTIALVGYLLLNLHVVGYLLFVRHLGERPRKRWYVPFVLASIGWAVSVHTVSAFLYSGLGGRPFWNTAILAPRFLASAFVSGPAAVILCLLAVRATTRLRFSDRPVQVLVSILKVAVVLNLFMVLSEVFTEFYTGGSHVDSARYLYFGLHGHDGLVPWIWTAVALDVVGAALVLSASPARHLKRIGVACVLCFTGGWIEKGLGLIVPGFVPSPLHELVEYTPSAIEWKVSIGVWALGLLVLTLGLKVTAAVFSLDRGHREQGD